MSGFFTISYVLNKHGSTATKVQFGQVICSKILQVNHAVSVSVSHFLGGFDIFFSGSPS